MYIRAVGFDVDGTMSAGVFVSPGGEEWQQFSRRDGHGVALLQAKGLYVFAISGDVNKATRHRMEKLGVDYFGGVQDKAEAVETLAKQKKFTWEELAYIGDDLNDLPVIEKAGFTGCPNDAEFNVVQKVKYRCGKNGGCGCVREFCNQVLMRIRERE